MAPLLSVTREIVVDIAAGSGIVTSTGRHAKFDAVDVGQNTHEKEYR